MNRANLIFQPKNGTCHRHAMAALTRKELFEEAVTRGECATMDWKCFEEEPEKMVSVPRFAAMWCEMFGLDLDGQPANLIEGAVETESGISCIECNEDPFVQMLYCIYHTMQPQTGLRWDEIALCGDLMRRHFIELEVEE